MLWSSDERGQSSVEAALIIPILMIAMLLIAQPAILLYDRMIMQSAASQGLRMLSTMPSDYGHSGFERLIETQLAAIPDVEIFKTGDWDIELSGNESAKEVSVHISNEVKPLPLLSLGASALGIANDAGNIEISVQVTSKTQPEWVWGSGKSPSEWVSQW